MTLKYMFFKFIMDRLTTFDDRRRDVSKSTTFTASTFTKSWHTALCNRRRGNSRLTTISTQDAKVHMTMDELSISMATMNRIAYNGYKDTHWDRAHILDKFDNLPLALQNCANTYLADQWEELLRKILSRKPDIWQVCDLEELCDLLKQMWHLFCSILNSIRADVKYLEYSVKTFNDSFASCHLSCILKLSGEKVKYKPQGRFNQITWKKPTRKQCYEDMRFRKRCTTIEIDKNSDDEYFSCDEKQFHDTYSRGESSSSGNENNGNPRKGKGQERKKKWDAYCENSLCMSTPSFCSNCAADTITEHLADSADPGYHCSLCSEKAVLCAGCIALERAENSFTFENVIRLPGVHPQCCIDRAATLLNLTFHSYVNNIVVLVKAWNPCKKTFVVEFEKKKGRNREKTMPVRMNVEPRNLRAFGGKLI